MYPILSQNQNEDLSQQVSTNTESNTWSDSYISTSEPILKKV